MPSNEKRKGRSKDKEKGKGREREHSHRDEYEGQDYARSYYGYTGDPSGYTRYDTLQSYEQPYFDYEEERDGVLYPPSTTRSTYTTGPGENEAETQFERDVPQAEAGGPSDYNRYTAYRGYGGYNPHPSDLSRTHEDEGYEEYPAHYHQESAYLTSEDGVNDDSGITVDDDTSTAWIMHHDGSWVEFSHFVDTGNRTGFDLISLNLVTRLGYNSKHIKPSDTHEVKTHGGPFQTKGSIRLQVQMSAIPEAIECKFYLIDNSHVPEYDVIFSPRSEQPGPSQRSLMMMIAHDKNKKSKGASVRLVAPVHADKRLSRRGGETTKGKGRETATGEEETERGTTRQG